MPQMEKMDKASELAETIKTLSINTDPPKVTHKPRDSAVADSWDDELADDIGDIPASGSTGSPYAPPPTPASPTAYKEREQYPRAMSSTPARVQRNKSPSSDPDKRPEKSTAVANRLIAGALGVKAPRRTEEQRKYDRAIKEQEIRRKNKEKEDLKRKQEESEKAKAAIWDD